MKLEQKDLGKWINVKFNPQRLSDEDVDAQRITYDSLIEYELKEKDEELEKFIEQIPTVNSEIPIIDGSNPYFVMKSLGAEVCDTQGELEEITDTYFRLK